MTSEKYMAGTQSFNNLCLQTAQIKIAMDTELPPNTWSDMLFEKKERPKFGIYR